nr:hypothetical protein [Tanacetum cinerariifolium]
MSSNSNAYYTNDDEGLLLLVSYRVIAWYKHESGFHDPRGSKGGTKKDRNTKKNRSKVVRKSSNDPVSVNEEDMISMAEKIHDMERQMLEVWEFSTRRITPLEVPLSMELGQSMGIRHSKDNTPRGALFNGTMVEILNKLNVHGIMRSVQFRERNDYVRADIKLKYIIFKAVPKIKGNGHILHSIRVEYEWKPTRCSTLKLNPFDVLNMLEKDVGVALSDTACSKGDMPHVNVGNNKVVNLDNEDSDNNVIDYTNETLSFRDPKIIKVTSSSMRGDGSEKSSLYERWNETYDDNLYNDDKCEDLTPQQLAFFDLLI